MHYALYQVSNNTNSIGEKRYLNAIYIIQLISINIDNNFVIASNSVNSLTMA